MAKRRAKEVELVDTDQRFTPEHVLEVVRQFGGGSIVLDPCTTPENPTKAEMWVCLPEDGKAASWAYSSGRGPVFINPPYSRGELVEWMRKCVEASAFRATDIIALIPSDLGTEAGQLVVDTCDALCFVGGRLTFMSPNGKPSAGAKQPSVIPYWGPQPERFRRVFSQLGTVWVR